MSGNAVFARKNGGKNRGVWSEVFERKILKTIFGLREDAETGGRTDTIENSGTL